MIDQSERAPPFSAVKAFFKLSIKYDHNELAEPASYHGETSTAEIPAE